MFGRSKLDDEHARVAEREALDDLVARQRVGGRGQRDARHARQALVQDRELQVLGPEVVAPLRHAVRLVDREQRDAGAVDEVEAARHQQALGRDVEEVELARLERALDGRAPRAPTATS